MKIKEFIKYLENQDKDREVVFHTWDGEKSHFYELIPSATPQSNSKNLLVFILGKAEINPVRFDEKKK